MVDALLSVEDASRDDKRKLHAITPEEMERVDRQGLCRDASADIFVQWYSFGGMQRGLSLSEIADMPVWLRKDFRYILGLMGERREARKHLESLMDDQPKPKPTPSLKRSRRRR